MASKSPRNPSSGAGGSGSSGSPDSFDLTIQGELGKIKDVKEQFPAANLLNALLRFITINVNTNRRDIHTSAQVAIRSKWLYDAIIALMQKLDQSSFEELENNWPLFDSYTTAIPILERILLNIVDKTNQDQPHTPPSKSTQEAVQYIEFFLADRKALKQALEDLKDKPLQDLSPESAKAITAEYVTHRRRDDDSIIKVIQDFIDKDKLTDRDIHQDLKAGQKLLSDVKKLVKDIPAKLQTKPPSEEVSGVVVRVIMTAYIPFAVISSPSTSPEWKTYLKGLKIWETLKDLLTKVNKHVDQPVANLEIEFSALNALLLKLTDTSIDTAKEMLELIKLAARIHRPYSGRTAALVKTYYSVDQSSRKPEKKTLAGHRHGLKQSMQDAIDYLITVKSSPYDLKTFSLDSTEYKDQKSNHKKQFDSTESQFTTFAVTNDWNKQVVAYETAVDVDEKNVKDAKVKLEGK